MVENEVTPSVASILQRMNIAPRSFGSISPPAHVAGAVACNILNMVLQVNLFLLGCAALLFCQRRISLNHKVCDSDQLNRNLLRVARGNGRQTEP